MSFFDDGDETASTDPPRGGAGRPPRTRGISVRPRPRRPARAGGPALVDHHTLMVRRRVAAGVAVVLLIVIVLIINGCLKSEKQQALKEYNQHVNQLATESNEQVSRPLFTALAGASGKSALNVELQIDQLRLAAQDLANRAKSLSTPSEMAAAEHNLELVFNLRFEGMTKVASLLPAALGAQAKTATTHLAGAMEILLASDVIYSQRVAPLIGEALAGAGITGSTSTASRFVPNLGWLEPSTVQSRLTGSSSSSSSASTQSGHHGSALKGVTVAGTALEAEPALNHIKQGTNPSFTAEVENAGEFNETEVKVAVTVTAGGKQYKASSIIEKTEPGKTASVAIPVTGVALGVAAKVEVQVEPVPGETNHEGTKDSFLAIFEQ